MEGGLEAEQDLGTRKISGAASLSLAFILSPPVSSCFSMRLIYPCLLAHVVFLLLHLQKPSVQPLISQMVASVPETFRPSSLLAPTAK